ncbi:unnamed protein product, partial [Symbiodinium pilosum]
CILLLQLGSTNDDHGKVDGEVRQRAVKTTSLWRALSAAGHRVLVLPSGGKDPDRFFNRTDTSHWKYVRKALLECGLPEENISDPGLEALHTVDEALMAVEFVRKHEVSSMVVITSDFHTSRARHLFNVAFASAELAPELLVLGVPNACRGEALRAYRAKEVKALEGLRTEPFGPWAAQLATAGPAAAALNANPRAHEPFFLTLAASVRLRAAFRTVLRSSRRCCLRLEAAEDGKAVDSSKSSGSRSDASEEAKEAKRPRLSNMAT